MLDHHLNCRLSPPRVDVRTRASTRAIVRRRKSRLTALLELLHPTLDRAHPSTKLTRFARVTSRQRDIASVLRPRLPGERQFLTTRTEPSQHLTDVRRSVDHLVTLIAAQLSKNNPGRLEVVITCRPVPFGDNSRGPRREEFVEARTDEGLLRRTFQHDVHARPASVDLNDLDQLPVVHKSCAYTDPNRS